MAKKKITKVDEALEKLNTPKVDGINVDSINKALTSKNYQELTEFMLRFSMTKDCQKVLQILSRIQENPQYLCGSNEFETTRMAASIDGERGLIKKFVSLMTMGMDIDRAGIDNILNRNHLI